jgi:hypothetical protein
VYDLVLILVFGWQRAHVSIVKTVVTFGMDIARVMPPRTKMGSSGTRSWSPNAAGDGGLVANRGLLALPEPADGDLFFDIEGARYYSEDSREFGLQYLFGVVDTAEADGRGGPGTRRSGPSTGRARSARSRS